MLCGYDPAPSYLVVAVPHVTLTRIVYNKHTVMQLYISSNIHSSLLLRATCCGINEVQMLFDSQRYCQSGEHRHCTLERALDTTTKTCTANISAAHSCAVVSDLTDKQRTSTRLVTDK
jgi:hypothetical protein